MWQYRVLTKLQYVTSWEWERAGISGIISFTPLKRSACMLMTSNQTSQNPNFSFFQLLIRSEVIRSVLTILTPIFKFALDLFFLVLFYTNIKHIFNTHTHEQKQQTYHIYTYIYTYTNIHICTYMSSTICDCGSKTFTYTAI